MKKMKWMGLLLIPMMLGLAFAACSNDPPPTIFTVTFNLNYHGATGAPEPQEVEDGQLATRPETDPRRPSQLVDFVDWFTDPFVGTAWNFDTPITEDITLFARWNAHIRLNEINGTLNNTAALPNRIFIEMINMTSAPISMENISIWQADPNFNNGVIQESWRGEAGDSIPANGFFVISGRQNRNPDPEHADPPEGQIFPGLSSSRVLTLEIRDSADHMVDRFHRAENDAAMNALFGTDVFNSTMGKVRIPSGTGPWYFYTGRVRENADASGDWTPLGTPGVANPTTTAGLIFGLAGDAAANPARGNDPLRTNPLTYVWRVPQE